MNLDNSFSCYLMSAITLNIFVLRKYRRIFELCKCFILFLSISGAISIKTGKNRLPVSFKIMSLTVYIQLMVFVLILSVLNFFFFIFEHNCVTLCSFCFFLRIITLLIGPLEGKHSRKMHSVAEWRI